ncbi:MAG: hypothetical protein ABI480_12645, partial [Chitinophagaceae bacterium]
MWYRDSFVIAENLAVDIETVNNGPEKWRTYTKSYTFIDLKDKSFYVYSSYSDTARLLNTYVQTDTGKIEGGWNFFKNKGVFTWPNKQVIADTIIDGIKYGRVRAEGFIKDGDKQNRNIQTAYFRCDKKGSFFYIDKPVSEQMGCPVLRFDFVTPGFFEERTEIVFLADQLTLQQLHVFDVWEKYIKQHPARGNK